MQEYGFSLVECLPNYPETMLMHQYSFVVNPHIAGINFSDDSYVIPALGIAHSKEACSTVRGQINHLVSVIGDNFSQDDVLVTLSKTVYQHCVVEKNGKETIDDTFQKDFFYLVNVANDEVLVNLKLRFPEVKFILRNQNK